MSIEINAVKRDVKGTGASRRLRHAGSVPVSYTHLLVIPDKIAVHVLRVLPLLPKW